MKDGWHNEEYFALAESQQEAMQLTAEYGISETLPGYFFIGLIGWDDFILSDASGNYFRVPTVPLTNELLEPYQFPVGQEFWGRSSGDRSSGDSICN